MPNYDRVLTAPAGFFIDFADFMTRLASDPDMRAEILIEADKDLRLEPSQRDRRLYTDSALKNQAKVGGFFGSEIHVFNPAIGQGGKSVDRSYMIKLDIGPFTADVIGVGVPLSARSLDGWRPYYGPRKPSWDPAHGLPNPLWRGREGFLTVFTEDPWQKMRVNPNRAPLGSTQDLDTGVWVAIGDFMKYVIGPYVKIDSDVELVTYLNRMDGKMKFSTYGKGARADKLEWFAVAWFDERRNLGPDQKKEASFRSANGKYYFFDEDPKEIW